ncbi:PucR family transcriptional regulator [Streptomyces sp. NPDC054841]
MEVEWAPAREPTAQRAWSEVLRPVAAELREAAAALAVHVAETIRAEFPELFEDADSVGEHLGSTEANIRLFAQLVERGADPKRVELPPATRAFARTEVQRQVAFASLTRFYRLGHEVVWEWLLARIARHAHSQRELLKAVELGSAWLFTFVDASVAEAERLYEAEQRLWLRSTSAARSEVIADIMAGREKDAWRAERRLRYSLERRHVAVIAWMDTAAGDDALDVLEPALAKVAAGLGGDATLIQPTGLRAAVMWVSGTSGLSAERSPRLRSGGRAPDGVRLAIGEPGSGLAGFRRTYNEAVHARRVASLIGACAQRVTWYADVTVAAMASIDMDLATTFVHRVLGKLADRDEVTRRLAETLTAYLDENASRTRTGQRLGVHGNTVRYRVLQAERLLGRSTEEDTLNLRVALALLPVIDSEATF